MKVGVFTPLLAGLPLEDVFRKLARLVRHGRLFDVRVLEEAARVNIGDCTFKEAFLRSGRILNITVHSRRKHQVPVLLNYLTAPDVVISTHCVPSPNRTVRDVPA